MKNIKYSVLIILMNLVSSCSIYLTDSIVNYDDINVFEIKPYICKRGNEYILTYKIKLDYEHQPRYQIYEKIVDGKLMFFFIGKVSYPEYTFQREYKIKDEYEQFIELDKVYWVNKKNVSETKLLIK